MNSMGDIIISPVANGFIVRLPLIETSPEERMFKMAGKLVGKISKDQVLQQIEELQEQEAIEEPGSLARDKRIHVFKTFSEVLAFLKITYENEK